MYVLAFRDMALRARGGVTSAALYEVDPLDPAYGWSPFQPQTLKPVDPIAFGQATQGAHVCFIVHGFNVNRDSGFGEAGSMAQEFQGQGPMSQLPPPAVLNLLTPNVQFFVPVLWPGDWWLPINYPFVLPKARDVGRRFAQFLMSSRSTLSRVSFFTHSFGARVFLETVQNVIKPDGVVGQGRATPPAFDTAVVTAGAATETVLDSPFYADAIGALRRVVVVSAATDEVLTNWFPAGNAVEKALWKNDPGPNIALGRDGPVLASTSSARGKTDWYVVTDTHSAAGGAITQLHSDYMPNPEQANRGPNGWTDQREVIAKLTQAMLMASGAPVLGSNGAPWTQRPSIPTS